MKATDLPRIDEVELSLKDEVRLIREMPSLEDARQIRIDARVSLRDMAMLCGFSHTSGSVICRWEQGANKPHRRNAVAWALALQRISGGEASCFTRTTAPQQPRGQVAGLPGSALGSSAMRPTKVQDSPPSKVRAGWAGSPIYYAVRCDACGSPENAGCVSATGQRVAWHDTRRKSATKAAKVILMLADPDSCQTLQPSDARPSDPAEWWAAVAL